MFRCFSSFPFLVLVLVGSNLFCSFLPSSMAECKEKKKKSTGNEECTDGLNGCTKTICVLLLPETQQTTKDLRLCLTNSNAKCQTSFNVLVPGTASNSLPRYDSTHGCSEALLNLVKSRLEAASTMQQAVNNASTRYDPTPIDATLDLSRCEIQRRMFTCWSLSATGGANFFTRPSSHRSVPHEQPA